MKDRGGGFAPDGAIALPVRPSALREPVPTTLATPPPWTTSVPAWSRRSPANEFAGLFCSTRVALPQVAPLSGS
jgi:hypothetical protein